MKDFGFPPQQIKMINTLALRGLQVGLNGPTFAGQVVARTTEGQKRTITDLMELRDWAYYTSPLHGWLSFSLMILGIIIDVALYWKERCQVGFSDIRSLTSDI